MMRCARGSPSSKSRSKSSDDLTRIKTGQKNVLVVTEVKKRDKSLKKRREKALSKEEKQILSQLNELYMDIDINVPSDQLNDEQKAIRDLKRIYDSEMTNRKPVAPTSKDKLAISKPLLGSVYKNPKLQSIASDPRFLTVEQIEPIDDDDNLDSAVTYKSRADDEALIVKYKASPWRSSDRKSSNKDRNNLHKVRSEYFQNQNETNDDYMEKQLTKSYSCDEIFPSSSGGKDRRPIPQGLLRLSSTEELNNYVDTRSGTIDKARASTAIDKPFYSENSLNLLLRSSSSSSAELNHSDDITIVKPRAAASKTSLETIDLNLEKKPEPPEPSQPNKIEDKSPKSRFISKISIPKVKLSFLNKKPPPVKEIKNDYNVTFETLEEICQDIDPNADDEKLSKEQLFAKKLLLSLNEFGRKGTLKRIAKVRKQKIVISSPIQSSAVITDNPKLLSVLKDPEPRPKPRSNNSYRHSLYSALENCAFEEEEPKERLYKSYDDINFTFDREKGLRSSINMYSDEDITKNNVKSSDNSSSGSTTSGEFFVNKNVNETVNKRVIMRTFSVGSDGEKSFQRVELSSGRFIFEVDQGVEELSSQKEESLPKGDEMDDISDSQVPVPVPVVIFDQNLELDVEDIEDATVDAKVEVLQDDEGKIEEEFNKDIQDEAVITTNEVTEGKSTVLGDKNEEIESKHEVEEEHNEEIVVEYNKTTEDKSAEDLKNKSEETALEYEVEEHNEEIAVKCNHEDGSKYDRAAEDKFSEDLNNKSEEIAPKHEVEEEHNEEIPLNKIIVENNEENKFCEEDKDEPNEEIHGKNNKEEEREYNEIEDISAEEIENNSGEEGKFEDANEEIIEKRFIEEFEQNSSEEIEDKRELGLKSDEKNEEFKENHIEEVQGRSDFEDRSSEDIIKIKGEELIADVIEVESKVFEDSNEELYEECEDSYEENETETGEYKSEFAQESEDGNNEEIEDRYPVNEDTESEEQGNHILLPEDKYIDHLFAPIGADILEETSPADSLQYNNNDTIDYKLQKYGAFSEEEEEEEFEIPLGVHAAYKNVVQEMKKRCSDAKKPETAMESNEDSEDSEDDDYNESRANIFNEESKREIEDFIENERIISSISDETSAEMHRVKGLTSSEKDLLECVNQRYSVVSEMNDSDWEFVDQMRKKYQARDGDDEFYVPIDDRQNEDESSRNYYENVEISPRIIIEEEKPSVIPKRPVALPRRQKIAEIEVNDTSDNSSQDSEEETYCSCNVDWSSPVPGESVNPVEFQMTGDCSISIPNNYSEIMTDDDKSNNEDVKVVEQNFSPGRDMESSPQNTTEVIDSNIRAIFNSRLTKKLDDLIDDEQASASAENADHKSDSAPPIREVKKFSSLFQELPQAKEEEDTAFGFAVPIPVPVSESNGSSEIMHHNETSPINDSHINLFRPNSETSLNDSSQNVNRNKVYEDLNGQRCKYNVTIASTLPYEETTRIKCDDDKSDKIKTNDSMTKVSRLKSIFESKSKDTDLLTKSDTKTMKVDCKVSSGAIPKTTRSRLNRSVDSDDSLIATGLTSRFGRRDYDTKGSFSKAKKVFERLEDHRSVDSDNFKFYPEVPVEGNSQYRETVNEVLHPDEFGQFLGAVDSFEIHEEKIRERNDNLILQKEREENFILQPIGEDNSAAFSSRNYKRKIILTEDDRVAPSPVVVDKSLSSEEQFEMILEAVKKDSLKKLSSSKRAEDEEVTGSGGGGSGNETFRKEEQLSSVLFDRNRDSVIGNSECGVVNPVKYDYDINEEV